MTTTLIPSLMVLIAAKSVISYDWSEYSTGPVYSNPIYSYRYETTTTPQFWQKKYYDGGAVQQIGNQLNNQEIGGSYIGPNEQYITETQPYQYTYQTSSPVWQQNYYSDGKQHYGNQFPDQQNAGSYVDSNGQYITEPQSYSRAYEAISPIWQPKYYSDGVQYYGSQIPEQNIGSSVTHIPHSRDFEAQPYLLGGQSSMQQTHSCQSAPAQLLYQIQSRGGEALGDTKKKEANLADPQIFDILKGITQKHGTNGIQILRYTNMGKHGNRASNHINEVYPAYISPYPLYPGYPQTGGQYAVSYYMTSPTYYVGDDNGIDKAGRDVGKGK